jgi:PIN domain
LIYLDASVALARVFAEDRRPPDSLWSERLISSRLLEYELWNRFYGSHLTAPHDEDVKELLSTVSLFELSEPVLFRALEPFPIRVRTLDALHLSTALFAIDQGQKLELATYDDRMLAAAKALKIPIRAM